MMVFVLQVNFIRRPQAVPLGELYLIQVSTVSNATHTVKGRERIKISFSASYNYGGAVTENRALTPKYHVTGLKRQGLFLSSSTEFYKTDWIGKSTTSAVKVSDPTMLVEYLANPDSGLGFYIARQNDSTLM